MKYFLILLAALLLASCDCGSCDSPKSEKKAVLVSPSGDTAIYYDRLVMSSPDNLKVHKFVAKKGVDEFFLVEFDGQCAIMDDSRRIFMPAKCPGDTLSVIHDTSRVSTACDSPATKSTSWSVP